MTRNEIQRRYPNASESFIRRNLGSTPERQASSPEPKQPLCDALPPKSKRAEENSKRYAVRITSFRRRLCDPDNLCGKYFVDCLRYSGLITDDTAAIMDYQIRQQKAKSKDEERTEIEVSIL